MSSRFFPAHAPSSSAHRYRSPRGRRLPGRNLRPSRARLDPRPCPPAVPRCPCSCPTQRPYRYPYPRPALYPHRHERQEASPVARTEQLASPEHCVPPAPETEATPFRRSAPRENMSCSYPAPQFNLLIAQSALCRTVGFRFGVCRSFSSRGAASASRHSTNWSISATCTSGDCCSCKASATVFLTCGCPACRLSASSAASRTSTLWSYRNVCTSAASTCGSSCPSRRVHVTPSNRWLADCCCSIESATICRMLVSSVCIAAKSCEFVFALPNCNPRYVPTATSTMLHATAPTGERSHWNTLQMDAPRSS